MKVFRWPRGNAGQTSAEPSSLESALPSLRRLREERAWAPLTPPTTVGQRAARVAEARAKVVYHPLPHERLPEGQPARPSWFWFPALKRSGLRIPGTALLLLAGAMAGVSPLSAVWFAGAALALAAVTVWAIWTFEFKPERFNVQNVHSLGYAPPFLSEALALFMAMRAMEQAGLEPEEWYVAENPPSAWTRAKDGAVVRYLLRPFTHDANYGIARFQHVRRLDVSCTVTVQLSGSWVNCRLTWNQ